jgi:group I intron endonuclease
MKTKIIGIYKIINNFNNKIYIGSSNNIYRRWKEHRKYYKTRATHIQQSIMKYGSENFTFEIIEECDIDKLKERETFWCNYYNSFDRQCGYNVEVPTMPRTHTESTKQLLKNINTGKRHNLETKLKCSMSAKKRDTNGKMSQEHKIKISNALKGIPKSPETIQKILNTKIKNGTLRPNFTTEHLKNLSFKNKGSGNFNYGKPSVNRIKIIKICPNTLKILEIYDSIKEAAIKNNSYSSNIIKCCTKNVNNLKYKSKTYYFKYYDDIC